MMVHRPARSLRAQVTLYGLIVLGGAGLIRGFLIQGLLLPVRVEGGSMAPHLLGRHFVQACSDCRYSFPFDEIPDTSVVCPNCGFIDQRDQDQAASRIALPGERVLLDRLSLRLRPARRWEVIAFRRPDGQLSVKRVVGLPGESIAIRGGDIWVNGHIIRKPLGTLQSMLVPVYSDRHRQTRETCDLNEDRWQTDGLHWKPIPNGYWLTSGGLAPSSSMLSDAQFTFLTYWHLACLPPPLGRSPMPILDSYGFNQNISRRLQPVTDVVLRCNVHWSGNGTIAFRFSSGQHLTEIRWPADGQPMMFSNGRQMQTGTTARPRGSDGTSSIFVGFADGYAFLAVDEQIVMDHCCQSATRVSVVGSGEMTRQQQFSIGGSGIALRVTDLRLSRDIHYLRIPGQTDHWPLQNGEFLMLGDNSPISEDARHNADFGVVSADQFLGRLVPQPVRLAGTRSRSDVGSGTGLGLTHQ